MTPRTNTAFESVIRTGIHLDREIGSVSAWMYMARHGIAPSIILRVLAYPSQRRKCDIDHDAASQVFEAASSGRAE